MPGESGVPSGNTSGGLFGSDVQLREYLRVAYKYRYIIVTTVVVCTIAALVAAFTATPRYRTASKIRISTYDPVLSATRIEDMLQSKSKESNYFETQIEEIKSYSLADRVLEDNTIKDGLFSKGSGSLISRLWGGGSNSETLSAADSSGEGYKSSISQIERYLKLIEVRPIRRTSLVEIGATAESANLAAAIANRHVSSYIDWVRNARVEQQARGLAFLKSQSEELREKVADLEREMADYAEANSIVAVNQDENITAQKMSQLNRLLTDATARRIEAENIYREAERSLSEAAAGYDDSSTQSMRGDLARLQAEYGQLAAKFTSSYPKVQQLQAQIANLKRSIEDQRKQISSGLKAKFLASQQEEKNLQEELEQQKSRTFELSKRQVQFNVLNRELTSSRDLLQSVLKQMKETSLAVESNASNISIVDQAVVPSNASYPRKKLWVLAGLFAGLGLGTILAFLLNYMDDTIRTPEESVRLLQIPNLGVVPSFALDAPAPNRQQAGDDDPIVRGTAVQGELEVQIGDSSAPQLPASEGATELSPAIAPSSSSPIMFVNNPKSLASEAYRTIRTGILLSQAGQPPRTILISSAQSSEGKTTSTVNLAASLASAGGRVVLVDADLRRPSVHKHFGLQRELPGLVEVVTGQATIDQVSIRNLVKRITIIPAGRIPPNPAELLGSLEMAGIIDALAAEYDYVLIDSPPILPVTDSVILSRYVDGVVLVIRGASTPKKVAKDARHRLSAVGARVLGTILNDVDVTSGDYYYYNRYYYSYYTESGESEGLAAGIRPEGESGPRASARRPRTVNSDITSDIDTLET